MPETKKAEAPKPDTDNPADPTPAAQAQEEDEKEAEKAEAKGEPKINGTVVVAKGRFGPGKEKELKKAATKKELETLAEAGAITGAW